MHPETNAPHDVPAIKLPEEVWSLALSSERVPNGFLASVRLIDGTVLDDMLISSRGYVLGKLMAGLAGAHGGIDSSMLTFRTSEIEGIKLSRAGFWKRAVWLVLNPEHPARQDYRGSHTAPLPRKPRTGPSLSSVIIAGVFWGVIITGVVLAVIGLEYVFGWLK